MIFHRLKVATVTKLNSTGFSNCHLQNALRVPEHKRVWVWRKKPRLPSLDQIDWVSFFFLFCFMFDNHLLAEPQITAPRLPASSRTLCSVNWLGNHQLHIIPILLLVLLLLACIANTSNVTFLKNHQHLILYCI